jgi:hypothetical protein
MKGPFPRKMLRLGATGPAGPAASLFIFIHVVNSLAFAFPAGTTPMSQDFQNNVLLWKQAPVLGMLDGDPQQGSEGLGHKLQCIVPAQSLEVGPEHCTSAVGPSLKHNILE